MKKEDIINKIKSIDIKRIEIEIYINGYYLRSEEEFKHKDFNNHYIKINSLNINHKNVKNIYEHNQYICLGLTNNTNVYLRKYE